MPIRVNTNKSPKVVRGIFSNIPNYINGSKSDRYRIGSTFWGKLTRELFKRIHESYRIRSEGSTDSLGNKWRPLAQSTIARRPLSRGNLSRFGLTKSQSGTSFSERSRGLLTPELDTLWRAIYAKSLAKLQLTLNRKTAKEVAAQRAWGVVKKRGAVTKKALLGNRNVLIMRLTDRIYDSLEPTGSSGKYRPRKDQLYEQVGNSLRIGTLVPYADYHNTSRPVIPANIKPWVDEAIDIAMREVYNHITSKVL